MGGNLEADLLLVDHGQVGNAVEQMYNTVKQLRGILDDLDSNIQPIANHWTGQGKDFWTESKARWTWAMNQMSDLLDGNSQTLYESNNQYQAVDKRGADMFSDIKVP